MYVENNKNNRHRPFPPILKKGPPFTRVDDITKMYQVCSNNIQMRCSLKWECSVELNKGKW